MWTIWIIIIILAGIKIGWICARITWQFPKKKFNYFSSPVCINCNERFKPIHQIPLIGFILSKGRCPSCGYSVPSYLIIIPIITPVLLVALFLKMQVSVLFFQYSLLTIMGILIYFLDLQYRIIPDIITLPMIGCGIIFSFFNGCGFWFALKGFALGVITFALITVIYKLITKRDGLGGGDIKLIAMTGLFLGFQLTFLTIFLSSIFGVIIYAFFPKRNKITIPYGSFIIMAMFVSIIVGNDLIHWYLQLWGI